MVALTRRPDLLSRPQAARYLGVSPSWLAHKSPEKGGPALLRIGRRIYYRQADLDEYIDSICRV